MKSRIISALAVPVLATGCVASNTIRTSNDTAIIQSSAAPACGGVGVGRAAQKQAAIETIKAGYDRYIIYDTAARNDVTVRQLPGYYQTTTTANIFGNYGVAQSQTRYIPGPTTVSGGYHQALAVKMFKNGQPGAANAVSARQILGPNWQQLVKAGTVRLCS